MSISRACVVEGVIGIRGFKAVSTCYVLASRYARAEMREEHATTERDRFGLKLLLISTSCAIQYLLTNIFRFKKKKNLQAFFSQLLFIISCVNNCESLSSI